MIIVDSREQLPFWKGKEYSRKALIVGDYTTDVLLNVYHIERKSLNDLYGTITKGHIRFKKEIIRAKHNNIVLVVVVEGTLKDFVAKKFYKGSERKIEGETLKKIVSTISRRHKLKFYWSKHRNSARKKSYKLLKYNEQKFLKSQFKHLNKWQRKQLKKHQQRKQQKHLQRKFLAK